MKNDLTFDFGGFSSTACKVEAATEKGNEFLASMFGAGAVGCELPKTKGYDWREEKMKNTERKAIKSMITCEKIRITKTGEVHALVNRPRTDGKTGKWWMFAGWAKDMLDQARCL